MIFIYIIKWTVIYSLLIYFIHYLYLFFEKNLTTTKTIDTLNLSMKEYDKIHNILNTNNKSSNKNLDNKSSNKNITSNNDNINSNIKNITSNNDNIFPNTINNDNQFLELNNDLSIQNELDDFLSKLNTNMPN
jgi:hypothetical protein